MKTGKLLRLILFLVPTIIIVTALFINARTTESNVPKVKKSVLDLSEWDGDKDNAFNIAGEFEFYWDQLVTSSDIKSGKGNFILVDSPDVWNDCEIDGTTLGGSGRATYVLHVKNARAGAGYAIRVENMASAYRLYIDDKLVASNGNFGDNADAPASSYRPQFGVFSCEKNSFDIVLQISNNAYSVGGMWEPLLFGSEKSVTAINDLMKSAASFTLGSLTFICLFFLIVFMTLRSEKEYLILSGIVLCIFVRLSISGDMIISSILPNMPISGFGWIDYFTLVWAQFLILYFIYTILPGSTAKWQVITVLAYSACVTLSVLFFPFEIISGAAGVMNIILLLIFTFITVQTARAVLKGMQDSGPLFSAMSLILSFVFYDMFVNDLSVAKFLLSGGAMEYIVLCFVQCYIVAIRYRQAQKTEMGLLRSQIRPHFIHNSLATIISVSRKDSERSRELLMDFSSYLRSCYDYEDMDEFIPLEQELEFVHAYIALEQARFGEKLKVEYRLDVSDIMVPPLILQPLVENSFIHGLREKEGGGTVTIYTSRIDNQNVRIGVVDDGIGMSKKPKTASERKGIGIININRRLSKLYHRQLIYKTPKNGGCEVYFEIPWREVHAVESHVD